MDTSNLQYNQLCMSNTKALIPHVVTLTSKILFYLIFFSLCLDNSLYVKYK